MRGEPPEKYGRLMSFLAYMVFAIPTAVLIWFGTNARLASVNPEKLVLESSSFWLMLLVFALVGWFKPNFFPNMLGAIWRGMLHFFRIF